MAESRLPASTQGAASGTDKRQRPLEMLPRSFVVEDVDPEDLDLTLTLAEYFFPGLTHIDQIDDGRKAWWIVVSTRLLSGDKAIARYVEAFSKVFQPAVDAQVADTLRKGAADEQEREERKAQLKELHELALIHQKRETQIADDEWNLKKRAWNQRLDQEKKREANGDWFEKILMVMTVIAFAVAIALVVAGAVVTQLSDDPSSFTGWAIAAGGSGGTGLLSVVLLALHRTRRARIDLDLLPEPMKPAS